MAASEISSLLHPVSSPSQRHPIPSLSFCYLFTLLSFAFSNGTLLSTYFLLILPIESAKLSVELKPIILGSFISLAGLTQLICPVIGLMSDRSTLKMGRRRPFMVLGGITGTVGLLMQGHASKNGMQENWGLYAVGFALAMCSLNLVFSSMIGLMPDKVPTRDVGRANGVQAFLSVAGSLSGFGVFFFVLDERVEKMYNFYILVMVAAVASTVLFIDEIDPLLLQNQKLNQKQTCQEKRKLIPKLKWAAIKSAYFLSPYVESHRDFFFVTLSRTFYYMGISAQTFFLYFLKDIIHYTDPQRGTALLAAVAQFCASLSCFPVGVLCDSIMSKPDFKQTPNRLQPLKRMVYAACAVLAIGEFSFVFMTSMNSVVFVCCITGIANGAYLTLDSSLAIDTLPNIEESAQFLGIWGVAVFIGTAAGPILTGPMLLFFGDDGVPNSGCYTIEGYAVLLGISTLYFLLSGFFLSFVRGEEAR